jgi:nicotinamide-nucleotide amidase
MDAEIIAIGTELLLGATVDTNSAYLAQQLATVGIPVRRITLVRDDTEEIVRAIRAALTRVELVICAGGLGPTDDDLTREAVAQATGRPLEFHQELLDDIVARFTALKRTMSPSNRRQAYVPQGAYIMRNQHGTAPAFVAEPVPHPDGTRSRRYVAALPGVPQELRYLTEHALLPYLREQHGLSEVLIVKEVHVTGLTEAAAGERIADIMLGDNPTVGITAKRGQHTIRIAGKAASRQAAEALIAPILEQIQQRFVGHLLGTETLEARVGRLLQAQGLRIALMENDVMAPVYHALTQTDAGCRSLAKVIIQPSSPLDGNARQAAHVLATSIISEQVELGVVVLAESGDATYRTVHFVLARHNAEPVYDVRHFDYGLAQAPEFVATAVLEFLRRWLEANIAPLNS